MAATKKKNYAGLLWHVSFLNHAVGNLVDLFDVEKNQYFHSRKMFR